MKKTHAVNGVQFSATFSFRGESITIPEEQIVNMRDAGWQNRAYLVCLDSHLPADCGYLVVADCDGDALDILADFLYENNITTFFYTGEELEEHFDAEKDEYVGLINVGNYCHYMSEEIQVFQIF